MANQAVLTRNKKKKPSRVSMAICENTGQNSSHLLCYYLLYADETFHELQYLATTWTILVDKKKRH